MTEHAYRSSRTFQELKDLRESLTSNLTTSQYLKTYDEFLERAMTPILTKCRFFDTFLGRLISWQARSHRRKISFLGREDFPRLAVNFLLQSSDEDRIAAYRNLQLDRGIRMEFLRIFQESFTDYRKACDLTLPAPTGSKSSQLAWCLKVRHSVETGLRTKQPMLTILRESEYWMSVSLEFKQMIMEKYVRLALNAAQRDYVNFFRCSVDLDDIVQTYLLYTSRAIDRCDYRQGALTSHIQHYFLAARAAVLKQKERHASELNLNIHDPALEDELPSEFKSPASQFESARDSEEELRVLSKLTKIVDPVGAARAYLEIPEALPKRELQLLRLLKHDTRTQPTTNARL
jgi:hypothetical protein